MQGGGFHDKLGFFGTAPDFDEVRTGFGYGEGRFKHTVVSGFGREVEGDGRGIGHFHLAVQRIKAAVAIGEIFEAGGQRHLAAGLVGVAVGRQRIGIPPAQLLRTAGAINHACPESIEVLLVEIAPTIGAVERDEECPARPDQLRGQQNILPMLVAHPRISMAGQHRRPGFGTRHGKVPIHAGKIRQDFFVFFTIRIELKDRISFPFRCDLQFPGLLGTEFHRHFTLIKTRIGNDRKHGEPLGGGIIGAIEEVLGHALAGDVHQPAAGLADKIAEHLRELLRPAVRVRVIQYDTIVIV